MTTITLPIKCSTVKKVNDAAESVALWEFAIVLIVGFVWSIHAWLFILNYRNTTFNPNCLAMVSEIETALLLCASTWIIFAPIVFWRVFAKYFPDIKCIEDEKP